VSAVIDYVWAADRNEPGIRREHLYAMTKAGNLWPMCGYGWNRSNGHRISILRNYPGRGQCRLCEKAHAEGKRPSPRGWTHKTKWL